MWFILSLFVLGAMLVIGAVMIAKGCCKCLTGKNNDSNEDFYTNHQNRRTSNLSSSDTNRRHHRRHRSSRLPSASSGATTTTNLGMSNLELHELPQDSSPHIDDDDDVGDDDDDDGRGSHSSVGSNCGIVITHRPLSLYLERSIGMGGIDHDQPPSYESTLASIPEGIGAASWTGESSTDTVPPRRPLNNGIDSTLPSYDESLRQQDDNSDLPRYEDLIEQEQSYSRL